VTLTTSVLSPSGPARSRCPVIATWRGRRRGAGSTWPHHPSADSPVPRFVAEHMTRRLTSRHCSTVTLLVHTLSERMSASMRTAVLGQLSAGVVVARICLHGHNPPLAASWLLDVYARLLSRSVFESLVANIRSIADELTSASPPVRCRRVASLPGLLLGSGLCCFTPLVPRFAPCCWEGLSAAASTEFRPRHARLASASLLLLRLVALFPARTGARGFLPWTADVLAIYAWRLVCLLRRRVCPAGVVPASLIGGGRSWLRLYVRRGSVVPGLVSCWARPLVRTGGYLAESSTRIS